jgi:hypothetical protein
MKIPNFWHGAGTKWNPKYNYSKSVGKTQRLHIVLQRKFQVGEAKRCTFVRCATANEDFVLEVVSKGILHTEEISSGKMLFGHSRFGKSVHFYIDFQISVTSFTAVPCNRGRRGGAVGWGTALQVGRSWVWFQMVSLEFLIDIILLAALWPVVDSTSNRNEHREYCLGG